MSTPTEEESLQLSVSNFGPIAKAEIDLRPLTVFVGPSNTGKSYLAILIYALHKFFYRYFGRHNRRGFAPFILGDIEEHQISNCENVNRLANWIKNIYTQEEAKSPSTNCPVRVPDVIVSMIHPLFDHLSDYSKVIALEIKRSFGVGDNAQLIRYGNREGAKITLLCKPFEYELLLKRREPRGAVSLSSEEIRLCIDPHTNGMLPVRALASEVLYNSSSRDWDDISTHNVETLIQEFVREVLSNVVSPLNNAVHYLPADRTGLMHAQRAVIASLIEGASHTRLQRNEQFPTLSGILADFLEQLINFGEPRGQEDLAANLEQQILRGVIHSKNSETGYPMFSYQPRGWRGEDLPLINTSSMVSELAPVILYLRHVVQPGDVLIIEEPESHLHPAMQVEFIRQLAAVVNSGIRVMLTTHSEWVLDELTNLVRLSDLPKTRREGIAGADFALKPNKVGVWLFEPKQRPRGSVVKEIPFDEEFGGFRSGFDEVAMGTYSDYAKISNRIERSKAHDESH